MVAEAGVELLPPHAATEARSAAAANSRVIFVFTEKKNTRELVAEKFRPRGLGRDD
jgi:hypothetical protein